MIKQFIAILVTLCVTFSANAQEVTTFTLDNGMQAVVIEDHRAPVAIHMVWYRAGAADDPPGKSGTAHFVEHLMFKATDNREAGELVRLVQADGGSYGAFTSSDYTAYYEHVAADRLGLMMELEADRMRNLKITEEDFETERDVVLEERALVIENRNTRVLREQQLATQYFNHPYGIPEIGWRHEIKALTRDDAYDFYNRFYAPNNAILVIAGDVNPEEVKALAETHYGPIAPSDSIVPRNRPQEPQHLSERRIQLVYPALSPTYMTRTYLAPERNPSAQKVSAALTHLAHILGGDDATSILGQKLQFEQKLALYVNAGYTGLLLDVSTFVLQLVPAEGVSPDEAESAMDAAIEEFLNQGIDDAQLEQIKFQMRADGIYSQDDLYTIAHNYGQGLSIGLSVEDIQAWPEILEAVTKEDVLIVARAILNKRRSVTGWLVSEDEE